MRTSVVFTRIMLIGIIIILSFTDAALGIEKKKDTGSMAVETVPSPSECGALEFDKATGGMKRKPDVDLVVTKVEITRNDRGVWVRPWIKNRCKGAVTQHIDVKIGKVIVTFPGLAPQVATPLGSIVGVEPAASYTVIVDYDNRIPEANELNNSCTRADTGNCP